MQYLWLTALIGLGVVQFCLQSYSWLINRFVNHSYDYRPNLTPLSPITITNWSCSSKVNSLVISCSFSSAEVTSFSCEVACQFWAMVSEVNTTEGYLLCKLDCFIVISTTETNRNRIPTSWKLRPLVRYRVHLNTRGEILYLRTPMYYPTFSGLFELLCQWDEGIKTSTHEHNLYLGCLYITTLN